MSQNPRLRILRWIIVLAVPLVLVAIDLRIVTGHWLVRWEYNKPAFPEDPFGLSTAERTHLAEVCVDYLATNADISLLADLELPNGEPAFNARELRHMEDVQAVYTGLTVAGAAAAISALGAAIVLLRSEAPPQAVPAAILQGCLFTVTLLGMVGAYMALSWNTFFTNFHRVFFEGDSWLFLYSDTLIRLFPMRFWIDVAIAIVAVLVAETIVVGGAGWWWRRSMSQQ